MAFKLPKDVDWYSMYQWIDIPPQTDMPNQPSDKISKGKENEKRLSNQPEKSAINLEKPIIKPADQKEEDKFDAKEPNENQEKEPEDYFAEPKEGFPQQEENEPINIQNEEEIVEVPKPNELPAQLVKVGPTDHFIIKPDPMFRLKKLLGINHKVCPKAVFNENPKWSDEFIFSCGSILVNMNCDSANQRFLFVSNLSNGVPKSELPSITNILVSRTLLFTFDDKGSISLWDNNLGNNLIITFTPQLTKITASAVSKQEKLFAVAGKDQYKRDMIIVYDLAVLSKSKKIEIESKQLSDFEITHIDFSPEIENAFVTCGLESIRFWKTKSGSIPGKNAIFQQPLRGQKFIAVYYLKTMVSGNEKATHVVAASDNGIIYKIASMNRTVEQVIKGTEPITQFKIINDTDSELTWATSSNNIFRLWDGIRVLQILEHTMEAPIISISNNTQSDKICILDQNGNTGVLKLKQKTYETLIRSHTDSIVDFSISAPCNALVTGSKDGTIRVWSLTELSQISEFAISNDQLTCISCSPTDPFCTCGFSSGFIRVFDLQNSQLFPCSASATKISGEELKSVIYSNDGSTLAVMDAHGKIIFVDTKEKHYEVFKTISTDLVNPNYLDMSFSPDNELFAHIGNNANTICIWETANYSLKYQLDLPGEIISKLKFAPNNKDLLVMTATSKLKYFRIDSIKQRCMQVMEVPGLNDMECTTFTISENNAFIISSGKDCIIKVFDYAMRGNLFPAFQAFLGHQAPPSKVLLTPNGNQLLVSCSKSDNYIYVWDSQVNSPMVEPPSDIMEITKLGDVNTKKTLKELEEEDPDHLSPAKFAPKAHPHPEIGENIVPIAEAKIFNESEMAAMNELEQKYNENAIIEIPQVSEEAKLATKQIKSQFIIGYNGHAYENIIWEKTKWIAYTSTNKLLLELLENVSPENRRQLYLSFGADKIDSLCISPNKKYLAAYTRNSVYTGSTSIYVIDCFNLKVLSHITISNPTISSIEFSPNNNILMILAGTETDSTLHFYDPIAPELLLRSPLPNAAINARWNPFSSTGLEFVVMTEHKYEFWLLTPELNLQYQEGKLFAENAALTTFGFSEPILGLATILLAIGKANGMVDLIDTKTNSPVAAAQIGAGKIKLIHWKQQRLIYSVGDQNSVYSIQIDAQEYFSYQNSI